VAAAASAAAQSVPPVVEEPAPSPPASAPSPSPSATPIPFVRGTDDLAAEDSAAAASRITAAMERLGIPGLSAAIVTDRRLRWSAAFGMADLENLVPAKTSTVFRLASITKPITATAVLQLVEAGKVDLDAPIQRYVPAFPAKPWPLTARHLLAHQSGIRNWTPEEFHGTRRFTSVAGSLEAFKDDPLLFEPGTGTHYTSLGYNLLGAVIEGASGLAYDRYLEERVFQPAGMDTARVEDVLALVPNRAHGYQRGGSGELLNSAPSDVSNRVAGGGLVATAEDVAKFAVALQRGVLLKPSTARAAWGRQTTRDRKVTGYGLGWIVAVTRGRTEAYHTGGQPRVSAVLYMAPRSGVAVVLLCNLEGVSTDLLDLARDIASALLP
jgi:serine beta-lactamase-like protein LACTB, mitochondrial